MTALYIISFILLVVATFALLKLTPEQINQDMNDLWGKQMTLKDQALTARGKKKQNRILVEMERMRRALQETGKEKQFSVACAAALLLMVAGCIVAIAIDNMFLIPVLAVAFALIPFAYLGELLHVDYGAWGIVLIGMFMLTKDQPKCRLQQIFWLAVISLMISKVTISVGPIRIPRQLFSLIALIPIFAYDGSKRTRNIWIQRGFYLFYPVHLAVLYLLKVM
jgi:hypothetical protein